MRNNTILKRVLSVVLVLCMIAAWIPPYAAHASGLSFKQVSNDRVSANLIGKDAAQLVENQPEYAPTDVVRVSIFLETAGVLDAGFAVQDLALNASAMAYRDQLKMEQDSMVAKIENAISGKLDVVWNLTLATNLISAYVQYGQIDAIEQIEGVRTVVIETAYEPDVVSAAPADPNMATSGSQTGAPLSHAAGYTGAGSRVAIIDTGLDTEHLSFDAAAFEYSLGLLAEKAGKTVEEYMDGLNLMDAEQIAAVLNELNVVGKMSAVTAEELYLNSKVPFAFNYIDANLNVGHMKDSSGEHGSHVAGIATANAYVPTADGSFAKAIDEVFVQGVAPDAQVIVMKVFGAKGGAYPADYMAAIEDAILLNVDSINLSLGSGNPGMSRNSEAEYQAILENLEQCGVVVAMSAGNSGGWADSAEHGAAPYLYLDDVSLQTNGSPGSFTNSLAVASVDNAGFVTTFVPVVVVGGQGVFYYDDNNYSGGGTYGNAPFATLAGEHEFVFVNGVGKPEEFAALGEDALVGKIAMCYRGETSFFEKANAAVAAGAIGVIIVNNVDELFGMNLTGYEYTAPAVSISLSAGEIFKVNPIVADDGTVMGWTGTLDIPDEAYPAMYPNEYYTMSSFSSWGVPGSLELKPEITAPGGEILSVNGANKAYGNNLHDQYEVMSGTSMASPQVAGMAAVVAQFIRENNLTEVTGLDARTLAQSLLMSTAVPMFNGQNEYYYPVMQQGAGLANVGAAVMADSYIMMNEDATESFADGKVKVELGDDPNRVGVYTFSFTINNLTDVEKTFALYADFFTQSAFASGGVLFMDTWTRPLNPMVTYTVNGEAIEGGAEMLGMDFNSDGCVNAADGQLLLDFATGVVTQIPNAANADLDNNAVVNSYDAYLFFKMLGECGVVVAANGSATVEVTVALSDNDAAWLANYENGAYLEGFVYAESIVTEEGLQGTTHSIPVLGFYGNWSDPSMFDKGTYNEYFAGTETRAPYLHNQTFANGNYNGVMVQYPNDSTNYWFGGNPVFPDAEYMPERDAISGVNGTMISKLGFTNIRNAADSYFVVKTAEGFLLAENTGEVPSAYYYVNGQQWRNTYYTLNAGLTMAGIPDDLQVEVGVMLIPEYYVAADGSINPEVLGDGVYMTVPMTVDNTAPVVEDIVLSLVNNQLIITVSDNQYVAGMGLLNKNGTALLASTGSLADVDAGATAEFVLDMTGISGDKFLLQVMDYAMNATTYEISMSLGESEPAPLPDMIAYYGAAGYWAGFDKNVTSSTLAEYALSNNNYYAAAIVDNFVLASTSEGMLHVMPLDDMSEVTVVADLGVVITDMAYNKADNQIYGVANSVLYTIDRLTGALTEVGTIGVATKTLACDVNGTFYCSDSSMQVYSFTLDTLDAPVLLVKASTASGTSSSVQTMEIDPNTGLLYWASCRTTTGLLKRSYYYFYEINPADGSCKQGNNLSTQLTALIIPDKASGDNWAAPTDKVTGIQLSHAAVELMRGDTTTLSAIVQPWTATDRGVTWTSADETIATVDENGVVTAVGAGSTVITVASVLDPNVTATCVITVKAMAITVEGLLQDATGNSMFFNWNLETSDTWTPGAAINSSLTSATVDTINNKVYVMNTGGTNMMVVDPVTGAIEQTGSNAAGVPLWDMVYSPYFSTAEAPRVNAIYYYYFLPAKNPMALDTSAFGLQSYLSQYTGASYLVAICSLGYEEYEDKGVFYDTEHIVMLDNAGYMWDFWIYGTNGGYSAFISFAETGLANMGLKFPGNQNDMFTSMYCVDYDNYYVSVYTGETNELYHLYFDYNTFTFEAKKLGNFGDDVWPAIITNVTNNAPAEEGNARRPENVIHVNSTKISAAEMVASVEQSVAQPMNNAAVGQNEKTVTVELTAKDLEGANVDTTNGVVTVTFNSAALTLTDVLVNGDYISVNEADGSVTFGYVKVDGFAADDVIATLVFDVLDTTAADVTVTYEEINDAANGYTEAIEIEFLHENTELRDYKAPTCTEDGYSGDVYCTDCGILVEAGTVLPATGHSPVVTGAIEPTCTEDGYSGVTYCSVCGVLLETGAVIPATGHNHAVTDSMEPTCTEDGYIVFTCECGDTYTEVLPAFGHNTEVTGAKEATCTEDGYTGDVYCTVCGELVEAGEVIPATGHAHVVTDSKEPTCTEDGYIVFTCECGDTYTMVLTAAGHNTEVVGAKEVTCTEDGYTGDVYCSVCGELLEAGEVIPATGHTPAIVGDKEATCTEDGYTGDVYCAGCGVLLEAGEVIPAFGHTYVVTDAMEPTCTEDGYIEYTCHCGDTYKRLLPATGHSHVATDAQQATCTEDGYITYTCHCGDTYTVILPAYGHNLVDGECTECDYWEYILGDVNGDGIVDTTDAKLIMQYDLGLVSEDELVMEAADVNRDGMVNTTDAKLIMQFNIGLIDAFPKP